MNSVCRNHLNREQGFTLTELLVALTITIIISGSIFMLLQKGQASFGREGEVADLNQSARTGLDRMNRDLMLAGYKTPAAMAITWADGGGINPDEVTIVYNDDKIPLSKPLKCGVGTKGSGGPCKTIDRSSTLNLEIDSLDPAQADPAQAYSDGMVLFAIETGDCNGDKQLGMIPFEVTQPPMVTNAGGSEVLHINHNPGQGVTDLNQPGGFNYEVHPDCAVIGLFRVVQYRIRPLPPAPNPMLERRDLSMGEPWIPVGNNIENLQVQYGVGFTNTFVDVPGQPIHDDPNTWITRVRVTIGGRSASKNLQGASAGVFDAGDTHIRKTFSTVVSLRNQAYSAAELADNKWN